MHHALRILDNVYYKHKCIHIQRNKFLKQKYMLNIKINMFIRKPSVALSYLNLILDNFKFESLTGIIHQL